MAAVAAAAGGSPPAQSAPEAMKKADIFEKGSTALGFHGPKLYEAKILDVEEKDGKRTYFVHYLKWAKKWDEWVGPERLLKDTPENRAYAAELDKQAKSGAGAKGANKRKSDGGGDAKQKGGSKKRKTDEDDTVEDDRSDKKEIKVKIPGALKKQLITDWENVTRKQTLVPLPREPTVTKLLEEFVKSKKAKTAAQENMAKEVVDGIKQYFERALGKLLLYRFERLQYLELNEKEATKGRNVCDIYGAEHLLRLFVKLPGLLAHTQLSSKETTVLTTKLTDFIKFLTKKQGTYFVSAYVAPDAAYYSKNAAAEPANSAAAPATPAAAASASGGDGGGSSSAAAAAAK